MKVAPVTAEMIAGDAPPDTSVIATPLPPVAVAPKAPLRDKRAEAN
jgi:hypothetical protein